jgi:hypothetical protein
VIGTDEVSWSFNSALYYNTQNFEAAFKKSLGEEEECFAAIKASHLMNHHGGN